MRFLLAAAGADGFVIACGCVGSAEAVLDVGDLEDVGFGEGELKVGVIEPASVSGLLPGGDPILITGTLDSSGGSGC